MPDDDKTTKPTPVEGPPAADSALSEEDLKKVSGGASDLFRRSKLAGTKIVGGVDESSPVPPPEPQPAIRIFDK